jgi:hypothetical protein
MLKYYFFIFTVICLVSCKTLYPIIVTDKDYYDDPFIKQCKKESSFIPPEEAKGYIMLFNNRQFKLPGTTVNKQVSWSEFDKNILLKFANDTKVSRIRFFMAINPEPADDGSLFPMTIMAVTPFGSDNKPDSTKTAFFRPKPLCPPPATGCDM